ncbi:MAG: Protein-disulfide isomerase [Mucilaginibacter sp.]|nr:Protein-disulfide isomerase [Mucilaginibacter sp.]
MRYPLNRLLEPQTNGPEITFLLSELLNVKISGSTIKRELEEHPDYPSLLSISDLLANYGVENLSVRVDLIKVMEAPVPFITQIKGRKHMIDFFTVVIQITDDRIHFFDPERHRWEFSDLDDFLKRCTGVVLLTEVEEGAGEKEYIKNTNAENRRLAIQNLTAFWLPAMVLLAGIVAVMQIGRNAALPFIFSLLTLTGAIAGVLLLWFDLDQHNPMLQQICSSGKKVNCGAILHSKASRIAGVSWSAIGASYFIGNLLLLLFWGITSPLALFVSAWLNAVAIPYVFYSVYYQWRVAKQWCVLCLVVQCLLILQLATVWFANWYTSIALKEFTPQIFIQTVIAISLPFIVISILIPAFRRAKERDRINTGLQQLKHNPQVFEALLAKEKEVTQNSEGLGITLGNPDSRYKIIKVCNPYCGPCAKAHETLEELLENNPDVQVQVIFTATNDDVDIRNKPVKHLLAVNQQGNQSLIKKAMDDWYLAERKDYEIFSSKYPMNGELKLQDQNIAAMDKWCSEVDIAFTPTIFISVPVSGGQSRKYHQLPSLYNVDDLKYFLSAKLE